MDNEQLRQLAETYMMLVSDRKQLRLKIENGEPEDEWMMTVGLSKGHAADLKNREDRLFSEVIEPLVVQGISIDTFLLFIREFTRLNAGAEVSRLELEESLNEDRQLLLAKLYLSLDDAIRGVGHKMVDWTQDTEPDDGRTVHDYLVEISKLEEEQAEILYQFAYAGLSAEDFRKSLKKYIQLSVEEYLALAERNGQ